MLYSVMIHIFLTILSMGITASVVIAVVLTARGAMTKLPKKYSYFLWTIVGIRLIYPIHISSPVSIFNLTGVYSRLSFENSLLNSTTFDGTEKSQSTAASTSQTESAEFENKSQPIEISGADTSQTITTDSDKKKTVSDSDLPYVDHSSEQSGLPKDNNPVINPNQIEKNSDITDNHSVILSTDIFAKYGMFLWLGIALILFAWNLFLLYKAKQNVSAAVRLRDNVYECDTIPSPFVLGLISPKIYIPFRMSEQEQDYILRHERYHIQRKDNIIKFIAFLITCVYWFHPLVWLSYFLMIRDMEMSCDEYVLQKTPTDIRREYSKSLLGFATNQRNIGMGLLAFGESDTRKRVKRVMKFKNYGKWIGALCAVLIVAIGVVCLTNAGNRQIEEKSTTSLIEDKDSEKSDLSANTTSSAIGEAGQSSNQSTGKSIASATIHGYRLDVVYLSDKKAKDGYYYGDFALQTSKDGEFCDQYKLNFGYEKDVPLSYAEEGFDLTIADYDGDEDADDFALRDGIKDWLLLSNLQIYRFFSVDEFGSIIAFSTSSNQGDSIMIMPNEYSPKFVYEQGKGLTGIITYNTDKNSNEEFSSDEPITLIRLVPINDNKLKHSLSPEDNLWQNIRHSMPEDVVKKLAKDGVWHISYGVDEDWNKYIYYGLADSADNDKVTLRLDFTCDRSGNLVQYEIKDYGFTDKLSNSKKSNLLTTKKSAQSEALSLTIDFAKQFLNTDLAEAQKSNSTTKESTDTTVTTYEYEFIDSSNSKNKKMVWIEETPARWDDGNHICCRDSMHQYIIDSKIKMVVKYESLSSGTIVDNTIDLNSSVGKNGAALYYAGPDYLVIGGAFGLYVFDRKNYSFDMTLDTGKLGCHLTNDKNSCGVLITENCHYIYLRPKNSNDMYKIDTQSKEIEHGTAYDLFLSKDAAEENLYKGILDTENQTAGYTDDSGKEHTIKLVHNYRNLGKLCYCADGKTVNFFAPAKYQKAKLLKASQIKNITKMEVMVNGELHRAPSSKAAKWLEKHTAGMTEIKGTPQCPCYDAVYLTLKDGTLGIVYPATDGCGTLYADGKYWDFAYDDSIVEFWKLFDIDDPVAAFWK